MTAAKLKARQDFGQGNKFGSPTQAKVYGEPGMCTYMHLLHLPLLRLKVLHFYIFHLKFCQLYFNIYCYNILTLHIFLDYIDVDISTCYICDWYLPLELHLFRFVDNTFVFVMFADNIVVFAFSGTGSTWQWQVTKVLSS